MVDNFIKKSNLIYNNFYDYSLVDYKNNKTKVEIICPIHGIFEKFPLNHINGQGCQKCSFDNISQKNRKSLSNLLDEFYNTHGNKYDYSLVNYKNTNTKVQIICKIHGIFEQTPKNHIKGNGCPKCAVEYKSKKLSKSREEFIILSNKVNNNFYSYDKVNYINNKIKVIINCPKHGDFKIIPSHHINGVGCSKCAGNYNKTNEEFINECKNKHNNKYDYSKVIFKNLKSKIEIICPSHGSFYQTAEHHYNGHGCPKCNSSKGEIEIRKILEKYNIKFIEQKRFKDCRNKKPLPFDFYLEELNVCIEFDGIYHYKPIRGKNNFDKNKVNENIKNLYCERKNIKLYRISYKKFKNLEEIIKNITNKK